MILSYYIHVFVPHISVVNVPSNSFTSVYVPMGFACPAVLDAMTACAATHLATACPDESRRTHLLRVSAVRQARCSVFLRERVSPLSGRLERDMLEAVAIILMLIGLEVQIGARSRKWMSQLDCVRNIIRHHGGDAAFSSLSWEAHCLYQHFLYHDVMGLVMCGVSEQPEMSTDVVEVAEAGPAVYGPAALPWEVYIGRGDVSTSPAAAVHPLLGLSTELFSAIQEIRQVRQMDSPTSSDGVAQNDLFFRLERKISGMQATLPEAECNQLGIGTRLDLITLAETYRLAALILLYRRSAMHRGQLPVLAQNIIALAERIPDGNAAEAGLTCPLFLAGAELVSEEYISRCARKLIGIRGRMRILNIQVAEEVLEEVWRERLNSDVYKNWESVLQDWQWVINLA